MSSKKVWYPKPSEVLESRFLLQEIIGIGPCGVTYRSRDNALNRDVVLKYFHPTFLRPEVKDSNLFRLFRTRGFQHKRIVSVHEVMVTDRHLFLTKEIVDGIPLRTLQKLRQENLEPFTKRELIHFTYQVCEALRWIHMLGVNGNIKPENILVDDDGIRLDDPYLMLGRQDVPPEHGAFPLGDHYLAQEQLSDPTMERRESDVFAVALLLGELLVGKPVTPAIALSEQGPFFSPELDEVFVKATSREPMSRYQSVSLFWDEIRAIFRVPAKEFEGESAPIGFIPPGIAEAWRKTTGSAADQAAAQDQADLSPEYSEEEPVVLVDEEPEVLVDEEPEVFIEDDQEVQVSVSEEPEPELEVIETLGEPEDAARVEVLSDVAPEETPEPLEVESRPLTEEEEFELLLREEEAAKAQALVEEEEELEPDLSPAAIPAPIPEELELEPEIPPMPVGEELELHDDDELDEFERVIEESGELGRGDLDDFDSDEVLLIDLPDEGGAAEARIIVGGEQADQGVTTESYGKVPTLPEWPEKVEQPRSKPPAGGSGPDSEYVLVKNLEVDSDLDEVLAVVQDQRSSDDDQVILLGDELPPPAPVSGAKGRAPVVKKSRTGLYIGLGGAALIALAVVLALVLADSPKKPAKVSGEVAKTETEAPAEDKKTKPGPGAQADPDAASSAEVKTMAAEDAKSEQAAAEVVTQPGSADDQQLANQEPDVTAPALESDKDVQAATELAAASDKDVVPAAGQGDVAVQVSPFVTEGLTRVTEMKSKLLEEKSSLTALIPTFQDEEKSKRVAEAIVAAEGLLSDLDGFSAKLGQAQPDETVLAAELEQLEKRRGELFASVGDLKQAGEALLGLDARKAELATVYSSRSDLIDWSETIEKLYQDREAALVEKDKKSKAAQELKKTREELAGLRTTFLGRAAELSQVATPEALEGFGAEDKAISDLETRIQLLATELLKVRQGGVAAQVEELDKLGARMTATKAEWAALAQNSGAEMVAKAGELEARAGEAGKEAAMLSNAAIPEDPKLFVEILAAGDALETLCGAIVEDEKKWLAQKVVAPKDPQIARLEGKFEQLAGNLKSQEKKLERKAQEWKKAGDKARSGEILGKVKDLASLRKDVTSAGSAVEKAGLEASTARFDQLDVQVSAAVAATDPILNETVVKAPSTDNQAELKAKSCDDGMRRVIAKNPEAKKDKKAPQYVGFCIDPYEYPGKGSKPKTDVSWQAANAACNAGGKRLCTNFEWKRACGSTYPYGKVYDPEKCNTVDDEGMERPILPSGDKSECKSGWGVYDMVGNVAEWTAEKSVNGGDSVKTAEDATCGRSVSRFGASPNVGFRCCADLK